MPAKADRWESGMKRKTLCILAMVFSLRTILLVAGFLLVRGRTQEDPAVPDPACFTYEELARYRVAVGSSVMVL